MKEAIFRFSKCFLILLSTLLLVMIVCLTTVGVTHAASVDSTVIIGDADNNGVVNIYDCTLLQKYLARIVVKTDENFLSRCDTNGDGKYNICDATMIQKYIAHMVDSLPPNSQIVTSVTTPSSESDVDEEGWGRKIYHP